MKVKIFHDRYLATIEDEINSWLAENDSISVFNIQQTENESLTISIFYDEPSIPSDLPDLN